MRKVLCLQLSLVVSIGLQYLACCQSAADNSYLWDQYSLVFESQLSAVFHSSVALQQAHIFAQKHRLLNRPALSYACADYKSGQMIAQEAREHPTGQQSLLPLLVDRTSDHMCFLLVSRREHTAPELQLSNDMLHFSPELFDFMLDNVPIVLKLHASVYSFIEGDNSEWLSTQDLTILFRAEHHKSDDAEEEEEEEECQSYFGAVLQQLSSYSVDTFGSMFWTAASTHAFFDRADRDPVDRARAEEWFKLATHFDESAFHQCHFADVVEHATITSGKVVLKVDHYFAEDAVRGCMAYLAAFMASDPSVNLVALTNREELFNFRARSIQQSAQASSASSAAPYTALGLTGAGQIITIADTGVDTSSCYFADPSKGTVPPTPLTSAAFDLSYRKVVQYNFNGCGDQGDEYAGHGTHVSGTAVGSINNVSIANAGKYGGVAPGAKLSFVDLGKPGTGLCVPKADALYGPGHRAGSRVGSNSWGGYYSGPGYYGSQDTDRYLYKKMNTVVFFAAGNNGQSGAGTMTIQASGKNSIAVGSSESTLGGPNITNIAFYSSHGPTYDHRIKPDLVAPGDSLLSALSKGVAGLASCSTISMTGTSMATPAAAGIALLVRQYFMSSNNSFWTGRCNPADKFCGAFTPSGVLVKAILLHSGSAMSKFDGGGSNNVPLGATPDSFQGYGRVTLSNVLPLKGLNSIRLFVEDLTNIVEDATNNYRVAVLSSATALKVTVSWYDPPSVDGSTVRALLQNLDLVVTSPSGVKYYGNSNQPITDNVNTNEQVLVARPTVGQWMVQIIAHALPVTGNQLYSVVITADGQVN